MRKRRVFELFYKIGLLSLPILVLVIDYVVSDPFKVIKSYESYYPSGYPIALNRDFVSMEVFLRYQPTYKWNSFIFGSSRSFFYEVKDWTPHIDSDRTFHFDASAESIYGIARKLEFLEQRKIPIRNALIILDASAFGARNISTGHLFIKHPLLSGQNWISFQLLYFETFFSSKFLFAYLDLQLSHKVKDYMTKDLGLFSILPWDYDVQHNELHWTEYEKMIQSNPCAFYEPRKRFFPPRPENQAVSAAVIKQSQRALLVEIDRILRNQKADFRIVISPLYDQIHFNPDDLAYLKDLFGEDRVYDFSGINDITSDPFSYYESSHYRPHVARRIMATIYEARDGKVSHLRSK